MVGIALAYFISALSPNIDVANAAVPAFVTVMLFFAGNIIRLSDIPAYWKWLVSICIKLSSPVTPPFFILLIVSPMWCIAVLCRLPEMVVGSCSHQPMGASAKRDRRERRHCTELL